MKRPLPDKAQLSEFAEVRNTSYPASGSATTMVHSSRDFTFTDYAPLVFRRIRNLYNIDQADYMVSMTKYSAAAWGAVPKTHLLFALGSTICRRSCRPARASRSSTLAATSR